MNSFYFYDLETSGTDPRRDRIMQFAGQRTDLDLNPVGDPDLWYCRLPDDVLPDPGACLVTSITPQRTLQGLSDAELARRIDERFRVPGTCVAGFNSLRFDDEFVRHLLWRNFRDPYAREWRGGNSRFDVLVQARAVRALRPDGVRWPVGADGQPVLRLTDLTAANGITHTAAHDALSDVTATIDLARLLARAQPRLTGWLLQLRARDFAEDVLADAGAGPLVHVSARLPRERLGSALVAPVCRHPRNRASVIVFDLMQDPQALLPLDPDALRERLYRRAAPGETRPALKEVRLNRLPVLAPAAVLRAADAARLGIDPDRCAAHLATLRAIDGLDACVRAAFTRAGGDGAAGDVEEQLYEGFVSDADRALCDAVAAADGEQLRTWSPPFADPRLAGLLLRYRARRFPETLDADERQAWQAWCRQRIVGGGALDRFEAAIDAIIEAGTPVEAEGIVDELVGWAAYLRERYGDD